MHLLHVALLKSRILKWFLHFGGNLCIPENGLNSCPWLAIQQVFSAVFASHPGYFYKKARLLLVYRFSFISSSYKLAYNKILDHFIP